MPNYQPLVDEPLNYFTLQNVLYTEDVEPFDSICGINTITPGDNVNIELTMEDNNLYLGIIEQPADTFRYRYKSEKGSHGGIKGENTARSKKSFPTVKVENCPPQLRKKVVVKVSLYTNEAEPKPHVYELTGKNAGGVTIDENFLAKFQYLAISTKKKEEVLEILKERKKEEHILHGISYDEASVEADALEEMKSFNLDSAKLCFEAFSKDDLNVPLSGKLFSNPINNQKSAATGDLKIVRLSRFSGKCSGGDEVFLLCDKVKKEDIKVRFFDDESDWEAYGEFNPAEIHHQVAIVLKTPPYRRRNVHKTVYIELVRPSDSKFSEPRQFEYIPDEEDGKLLDRKMRNMQTALVKNESSKSSRKRRRTDLDEVAESSPSDSAYSSAMDSPQSSVDEPSFSDLHFLTSMDLGLDGYPSLSEILELVDEDSAIEGQMANTSAHNVPSQDDDGSTMEAQMGYTFAHNVPSQDGSFKNLEQLFPQCYLPVVETDGMNEILSSMDSMSLAGYCYRQEQEMPKMQKASNDFVSGMKRILESRGERTFLHYATHLISLEDEDGNSMLHLGIMEQNENWNFILKMVKMASEDLINSQNKFQETPLHLAVKGNHVKILLLLLAWGGDPNLSDRNGNNCLHLASKYGHIKCLKVLMPPSGNRRAWKHTISDIDIVNYDGMSALHIAVMENFEDCVNFLLNSKADVNLPEKKCGRTSLHLAIGQPSLLKAILKQPDVDIHAEDFGGYTAVQLACLKTGRPFEVVSSVLEDDKDKIAEFLESCRESSDDNSSSEEETDEGSTSEFEDAVEDFGSISSSEVVCKAVSTSERTCTNEKKSSLMKIEEELHKYLDRDDNWKKLAEFIGLDARYVALLDEGLSSGQTVLRKIKDLYHPCHLQTMIEVLQFAGLEEGVQILQKNS